jgi:two-component system NtrC family response regulator
MSQAKILVIDDDSSIAASLELLLKQAGYSSEWASDPETALSRLAEAHFDLVLQDMNFSRATTGEEGLALLGRVKAAQPDLPVLLITAWGSIALAVAGMKAGAADFITKPWSNAQILQVINTALGIAASSGAQAGESDLPTRDELDSRYDFAGCIGEDPKLLRILDLLGRVADTDASVLITGDSGTGKEIVAEAIHRNSRRQRGPFVKVNLGGISSSLFESEMFGHVRGAFTDAHRDRRGRFGMADGGTILLDEIGELDLRNQVKMLRVLQDRSFEVLGSSETKTLDLRVISATNVNLAEAVATERFREDLLYRLNLISVHLPSLAERPGDIPLLARHFLSQTAAAYDRPVAALGVGAGEWLCRQPWPGNIRQLKHLIERTLLVTGAESLEPAHFERTIEMDGAAGGETKLPAVGAMTIDKVEKAMILRTLAHHDGNISRAAASLGLSRAALYRRLDKHGIRH